jgi:hypothetical protein
LASKEHINGYFTRTTTQRVAPRSECFVRYGVCKVRREHKEIYETESSDRSFEEETKLSGFAAAPVKNEGSAIAYDNAQEAWSTRYTHETIALGFSITEEAIEDNLYDSLSSRYTKSLARAMAYTKQTKAAAVLNNGFTNTSQYYGGDGVPLFSTSAPNRWRHCQLQHSCDPS